MTDYEFSVAYKFYATTFTHHAPSEDNACQGPENVERAMSFHTTTHTSEYTNVVGIKRRLTVRVACGQWNQYQMMIQRNRGNVEIKRHLHLAYDHKQASNIGQRKSSFWLENTTVTMNVALREVVVEEMSRHLSERSSD